MERLNIDYIATQMVALAKHYSEMMTEIAQLKKDKAIEMIVLMDKHGSKAKAEVYYDATPKGQRELELTYISRGVLEEKRALKAQIDIIRGEQFGNY